MSRRHSRATLLTAALIALTLTATGCTGTSTAADEDDGTITIGFNPGPYLEMFTGGIQPLLEAEGYTIVTKDFTDGVIINVALSGGEIDASIMQHSVYQDAINEQEGLDNTALVQVPTPPMSLFGGRKSTLDEVGTGSQVAVPNQPSNLYRAFQVLEQVGWITLSDTIDPATASLRDVVENPHDLQFVEMENAQQVASLQDVDYSVIQGNFVISGGLSLTDALELEDLSDEFSVVVSVDAGSVGTEWAEALKSAYESDEFADFLAGEDAYAGYNIPPALEG